MPPSNSRESRNRFERYRDLALIVLGASIPLIGSATIDLVEAVLLRPGSHWRVYVGPGALLLGMLVMAALCYRTARLRVPPSPVLLLVMVLLGWTALLAP